MNAVVTSSTPWLANVSPQRLRTQSNANAIATMTPGTAVTTGATSSTKGSATQLIASTKFDVWGVTLVFTDYGASATASDACFDLLLGANDDVLIPNILCGYSPLSQQLVSWRAQRRCSACAGAGAGTSTCRYSGAL